MARFILKWRYLKAGRKHGKNLVQYIATRDGVEKCDESWKEKKATKAQEKMIEQLVKDFPDVEQSLEYQDYTGNKNRYTASEFITRAIEENLDRIAARENYVQYIAKRPRVEKVGEHGLFSGTDEPIHLPTVANEVANHDGAVWTMILSLRREDAAKLGYDNAQAWKELLREKTSTLAKEMKIPPEDLQWYGAFHNEGNHPHVHLVAYSKGKEPYMTRKGLERLKSSFANEIFKQELYHVFDEQTRVRDELRGEGKKQAEWLAMRIRTGGYENPMVESMMELLKEKLKGYKGKRVYGYLPKDARNLVDGIVDELAKDERLAELYELWYKEKDKIVGLYQDEPAKRVPLSENEEFKSIRNAVVREAFHLQYPVQSSAYEPPSTSSAVIRLFHHLSRVLQDRLEDYHKQKKGGVESKLRRQINEKKKAQGLKQE